MRQLNKDELILCIKANRILGLPIKPNTNITALSYILEGKIDELYGLIKERSHNVWYREMKNQRSGPVNKPKVYIDSQGHKHHISKDAILIELGKAKPLLDLLNEAYKKEQNQ